MYINRLAAFIASSTRRALHDAFPDALTLVALVAYVCTFPVLPMGILFPPPGWGEPLSWFAIKVDGSLNCSFKTANHMCGD